MLQVNNSSHTNYESINSDTVDTGNKSTKKTCMGSRLFAMMAVVVTITGICLLIYGFNGAFKSNSLKNWNSNAYEGISPNVDYSWAFEGVGDVGMLTNGDIITIRGLYGGLLRNRKNSDKVETVDDYKSNRILWQVYYGNGAYYFRNLNDNCYLRDDNGYLKCLSFDDNSYFVADSVGYYDQDSSNKKRYYTILKNKGTNKCFIIGSTIDDKIGTSSGHCDDPESMVFFEIVSGAASSVAASLDMELIDSSLEIQDDASVTLTGRNFLGIGNINGLNSGNIVAIRGFNAGLLRANGGNGKIQSETAFVDNLMLWIVGYDEGREAYYFQNYGNRNCYMATSNSVLKCSSDLGDGRSYWFNGGNYVHSGDSSNHPRVFTSIENYDNNKCLKIQGNIDYSIELRKSDCGGGSASSWVRFEIVSYS